MQRWYSLAWKQRKYSGIMSKEGENVFFLAFFVCLFVCLCSDSLAGDASSRWKSWHLLRSQEFDDVQKVGVLLSGPHHLDDFCEARIKLVIHEEANRSLEWRVFCCWGLERLFTFHFRIDMLLQLCLLLQGLRSHLGGAGEADDDDADVIQAALWRETEHRQIRVWGIYSNWLFLHYIS